MALLGVDTSSLAAKQPLEMLLISSASPDPHSTLIIDPRTGVSAWSYKGSELQGASTGLVEVLGNDGDHLVISTKERRLVHVIGVHNKDRFHQKMVMPGNVTAMCGDKKGRQIFMAIGKQIYTWLLSTGELLSVIDAHYQTVTRLAISEDDSMLFSTSKDGAVHGYLIHELISSDRDHTVSPFCKFSTHTLAVTDLKITPNFSNPRLLTAGLDHICALHSISLNSAILKISADRPITSCAIDAAETRIWIGTDLGNIAQINVFQLACGASTQRDLIVTTSDEMNTKFRILNGHSDEITRLAVNCDGNLLASGDATGKYCIWEVASHQCLKVSNMRASIQTLRFVPYFKSIANTDLDVRTRPCWELKREPTKLQNLAIDVAEEFVDVTTNEQWKSMIDETLEQLLSGTNSHNEVNNCCNRPKMEEAEIEILNETNDVITIDDNEEQAPVFDRKSKKKNRRRSKQQNTPKPFEATPKLSKNSAISDELQQQIDELKKENQQLKQINSQMYEFVAKEMANEE